MIGKKIKSWRAQLLIEYLVIITLVNIKQNVNSYLILKYSIIKGVKFHRFGEIWMFILFYTLMLLFTVSPMYIMSSNITFNSFVNSGIFCCYNLTIHKFINPVSLKRILYSLHFVIFSINYINQQTI